MKNISNRSLDDFKTIRQIGNGAYGDVFLVEDKETGKQYAAKKIKSRNNLPKDIKQEIDSYSKIDNIAILNFYGYFPPANINNSSQVNYHTILLEYMANGSLKDLISSKIKISITKKMIIIFGIAYGMEYLHSKGIFHRDLKPANILLDENFYPKICDFGISIAANYEMLKIRIDEYTGTPIYMAPEIFKGEPYSYKVDVYSFSLIVYELLSETSPFQNYTKQKLCKEVIQGIRPNLENVDILFHDLINKCWSNDPLMRPTFYTIIHRLLVIIQVIPDINFEEVYSYINLFRKDDPIKNFTDMKKPDEVLLYKGLDFYNGNGEQLDHEKAAMYFKKSADLGNVIAMYHYARMCFFGDGIPVNKEESVKYLKISTKLDCCPSIKLASYIEYFDIISDINISKGRDDEKAAGEFIKKLADCGNVEASLYYGAMAFEGETINTTEGFHYIKFAADNGCVEAMYIYGNFKYKLKIKKEAACYFHMALNQGHLKSMYKYAIMLFKGDGIPQNLKEADFYYKTISNRKDVDSIFFHGMMILHGMPNQSNDSKHQDKAVRYILKAAQMGHAKANYIVGCLYFFGYIFPVDDEKAIKYMKIAAEKNHQKAVYLCYIILSMKPQLITNENEQFYLQKLFNLVNNNPFAIMTLESNIIPKIYKYRNKEYEYLTKLFNGDGTANSNCCYLVITENKNEMEIKSSADKGNVDDIFQYGQILFNGNGHSSNKKEAIKYFKMGADKNEIRSMFYYGVMLFKGDGIKQNKKEGIKYIKKSADLGYSEAIQKYAMILLQCDGIESNKQEAIEYFKKAADNGNTESMVKLGNILLNGDGIDADIEEGVRYIKEAAYLSDEEAQLQYGLMLLNGDKIQMNKKKAAKYFQKVISKTNNETAMIKLAYMLKNGDGIPVDRKKAMYYFQLLSEQGNEDAMYEYVMLLMDENEKPYDVTNILKYLKISTELGNKKSMALLGKMLFFFYFKKDEKITNNFYVDINIDISEIMKYLKKAADSGDDDSLVYYAFCFLFQNINPENIKIGLNFLKTAADRENDFGIFWYAYFFIFFNGIEYIKEAEKYLKKSADKGNYFAIKAIGIFTLLNYISIEKEEAEKYLKISYEQQECNNIIVFLKILTKEGQIQIDPKKIIKYTQKLVEQENIDAINFSIVAFHQMEGCQSKKEELILKLKNKADEGNIDAIMSYADILFFGKIIPADIKESSNYMKKAADKGNIDAIYRYINILNQMNEPLSNMNDYLIKLKNEADKGNHSAMCYYSVLLTKINGINYDQIERQNYLKKAIKCNNVDAMHVHSLEILLNIITNKEYEKEDEDEAFKYLKKAADYGKADAMLHYGMMSLILKENQSNVEEFVQYIKKSADLLNINACWIYGTFLFFGKNVTKNKAEAEKYLKFAAENGNDNAMLIYGILLRDKEEDGNQTNINKSIYYIKKSADLGNVQACFEYANIYLIGEYVKVNLKEAVKYLKIASDNDHDEAMFMYAIMLLNGLGIHSDIKEAIFLLKKSTVLGNDFAPFQLGIMYYYGNKVQKNKKIAAKFWKIAADLGNDESALLYGLILCFDDEFSECETEICRYFKLAFINDLLYEIFIYMIQFLRKYGMIFNNIIDFYFILNEHINNNHM